jgi:hypothetical protein
MRSETSLPNFSLKSVMMCVSNPICTSGQLNGASANMQDGAKLDVSTGVEDNNKTFFDVRVFNPLAPSNQNMTPAAAYRKHEREKYEQRIREVEHSSFTPLVLSAAGQEAWARKQH